MTAFYAGQNRNMLQRSMLLTANDRYQRNSNNGPRTWFLCDQMDDRRAGIIEV
jgi:hypothetical protein